jgi:hypothetical protein
LAMVFGAVAWLTTRKPAQAADSTERPPLPSEPPPPVLNEPLPPIASDILRYDASRKHGPGPKSSFEIPLTEVAGWKRGTRFSLELELNGLGPDSFVMSGGETARSWAGILELTLGRKTVSWESGELSKSIDSRKITLDDCVRGSEELPVLVVSVASATRFSSENPNRDGGITLHFPRGRWVATPK